MLTIFGVVVYTSDLSKGVIAGVILSAIFFVAKISKLEVKKHKNNRGYEYKISGQLFFASVEGFVDFLITMYRKVKSQLTSQTHTSRMTLA